MEKVSQKLLNMLNRMEAMFNPITVPQQLGPKNKNLEPDVQAGWRSNLEIWMAVVAYGLVKIYFIFIQLKRNPVIIPTIFLI